MKTEQEIKKEIKKYEEYAKDLPSRSRTWWYNKIKMLNWVLEKEKDAID